MLSCSIWFSAPSFWMGGGLESRCVRCGWCRRTATSVLQPATGHDPEPLASAFFFVSLRPILELWTPQNLFSLPSRPLSTGFPTLIQNACIACRVIVKCTDIHLSFPSRPVGEWFPRNYVVGIGGAISQMLLNMRSILSGNFYLLFERQMCVCVCVYVCVCVCVCGGGHLPSCSELLSGGQYFQFFFGKGWDFSFFF